MKTLSISGIIFISKLVGILLLNSFILGPLAVFAGLVAEALLATHESVLFGESSSAFLIIVIGGFFSSFVCMGASLLLLLPIGLWELSQTDTPRNGMAIFKKYLPVPMLLSVFITLLAWVAGEFEPLSPEPLAIILSFYLTASAGLYLMSRKLQNSFLL